MLDLPPKEKKREVYMDHAAATPMRDEVLRDMQPFFSTNFGNASALYSHGRRAKEAMHGARSRIAKIFNCQSGEILFVGSGTESNNMAIFGIARKYISKGKKIVTTTFEHHAVLHACDQLAREGYTIEKIEVDRNGCVEMSALENAIDESTLLVSVMYANNEIGTLQDISAISKMIKAKKKLWGRGILEPPFFHTDACQASGYCELDVTQLGVDLMTINGSKMYGPKGVGVLFMRRGIQLQPIIFGGGQENKLRSGTENIPAIVGMATALELVETDRISECARLIPLRDYMIEQILLLIPKCVINGDRNKRLPNNINVSILDIEGEAILLYLDEYGISASTGSACDSSTLDPSHVSLALCRPDEFAHGSMRFSLGRSTTREDIDYTLSILQPVTQLLRSISPINVDMNSYDVGGMSLEKAFVGGQTPHFVKKLRNKTN